MATNPDHNSLAGQLRERLERRQAVVAVMGLGYVGLPVVRAIHDAGLRVVGFDVDQKKIDRLNAGQTYIRHLGADFVEGLAASDRFTATANEAELAKADAVILCVPTPLDERREPDLRDVRNSTAMVGRHLRPGQLIVLESTTYPGTTRDVMGPILEQEAAARGADLRAGRDFFLAYSPEREDPGRTGVTTAAIPKLVGGIDADSGDLAELLYGLFIDTVHRVESAEIAEAAKLLENIYRAVNIALVNELKVVLGKMGIDVWSVIEAAKTKPFGFKAFYPGPGLGGHCIPIDPFYLAWKAREVGRESRFIELAGEVNRDMPALVVQATADALNQAGTPIDRAEVLVIGIAYKPNVDDIRESPAAEIIELLHGRGASVHYHDPHIPAFPPMRRYAYDMESVELTPERLVAAACVLIVTDHGAVDWDRIGEHAPLIVDTRNAMARAKTVRGRVVKA